MSEELLDLPRMQFHRFEPWDVDPKVCGRCGQLPQAHPAPGLIAQWDADPRIDPRRRQQP